MVSKFYLMVRYLPNALTLSNLFCGCVAVVLLLKGPYYMCAAFMIAFSLIFDFLDGAVSRLLNVKSLIGKELDSLADMVSFGLAPGVIVFTFLNDKSLQGGGGASYAWMAFFIPLFSALRLAHFNLDNVQSENFKGLSTPANALFFIGLTIISPGTPGYDWIREIISSPILILILIFFSCYLLASKIPMFSLKFKSFSWAENKHRYLFLMLSGLLLIVLRTSALSCIIILYIIFSIFFKKKLL
ncbi:MAG: CDP-alcohol phosphatidyltransferase family protein [Flavobacteriales bacterium Tduv]